ncbi:thiamine pyrophosphate-dependent enzyme [Streptomyces sp. NPDC005402]|uniref:thiamine pyrophosphate-dependent enzyme n=1 Tax=Streptomyces sp. NPDC005402 TaxID=3155338 RepID=UPI0033AC8156
MPDVVTGAQAVVGALLKTGVDAVFSTAHAARLLLRSGNPASGPEVLLLPHGQDAGHAASGYATATGRTGVCLATPGAGITELVTPLYDAHMDSVPVVALAFSEHDDDTWGMMLPITKHSFRITEFERLAAAIQEAFHIASTGRPGPVLVDIAPSLLQMRGAVPSPQPGVELPGFRPPAKPSARRLKEAAEPLIGSSRPIMYVGGGVIKADASHALRELAEFAGIPVVTTLMGRGALPHSHPLNIGMPGLHGSVPAVGALQESDLVIALGARFDDRVTGDPATFAPCARVVHADVDAAEIGKNRRADVPIVGDAKWVALGLVEAVKRALAEVSQPSAVQLHERYLPWRNRLAKWAERYPLGYRPADDGSLVPQEVIERIGRIVGPEAIYVAGVGQHQMWASQFLRLEHPRSLLNSGGAGTMGYAVPAAIGAATGRPGTAVWAIDGDGCFQMTGRSLMTAAAARIPLKVAVINNSTLGMVRQLQALHYAERHFGTDIGRHGIPDYVAVAESYGCLGLRCSRQYELDSVIHKAAGVDDRPVVIDFVVDEVEMVWPMVPPSASSSDIQIARDMTPDWDSDD